MELDLAFDHYCTYDYWDGEQYGSWEKQYSYSVGSIATNYTSATYYNNRAVYDGTLVNGETIYTILAVWSSGDSFGNDSCGSYDFIIVNKDKELAEKNLKALQNNKESVLLTQDNGVKIPYYRGWTGYFESLDELNIYTYTYKAD